MDYELFMEWVIKRNPAEKEFIQAVSDVAKSVIPFMNANPKYKNVKLFERLTEPDKVLIFRVSWVDDRGQIHINRGYCVQFNNAIGPYKGGFRFDPLVTLSVFKFLGFEQLFKNALTGFSMGGGKSGADFKPKGKSDLEIMRFCQAYMTELYRHTRDTMDRPTGDIGVRAKEVGYLVGQYKKLTQHSSQHIIKNRADFNDVDLKSTGYGVVYFAQEMLFHIQDQLHGKICVVSGSGSVALHVAELLISLGACVVTLSDRLGFIHDPKGFTEEKLSAIKRIKLHMKGSLSDYAQQYSCSYYPSQRPWDIACDAAFPCAAQNELKLDDAKQLIANGCGLVVEGATMPTTMEAIDLFRQRNILFAPGTASNSGGIVASILALSPSQVTDDAMIQDELKLMMRRIHDCCVEYGGHFHSVDYVQGAVVAAFVTIADAMLAQGVV